MKIQTWLFFFILITNVYIVFHDVKNRKISNNVIVLIVLSGFFSIFIKGDLSYFISPLIILIVGIVLFKINLIAAGDIKLFSALALMIKQEYILLVICIFLFIGGIQAYCQFSIYKLTNNEKWVSRGVPYGLAICTGSVFGILASI
ncbi:prepilin peptidase [Aliivibrio sp. S4TY2]|uniref:A24 family peptidase n=1 Tax=unclassified Aliivibrio TaxID=2645654 RepID=UPI002378FC64|nr:MULTISPECIES: prepilin peptidase [unclassified Aliivibrio]MDD9157235.1 prepilin peptidase [Aliivibrio sp. S4TY2]MDD9161117.1 prepilin peptidase [Aliivibrio sp. S4TY1]MDD9165147.1 prepilin peptidase [Aliivibrio sp. S4MY2]MDD9169145.1 prepilin peptidase [Aliivibrio sp. S4MY4]MDD9186032.1 prepilin peptidase [Aliivibrio sp. S4MY3]